MVRSIKDKGLWQGESELEKEKLLKQQASAAGHPDPDVTAVLITVLSDWLNCICVSCVIEKVRAPAHINRWSIF